jgi:hypothetical protein
LRQFTYMRKGREERNGRSGVGINEGPDMSKRSVMWSRVRVVSSSHGMDGEDDETELKTRELKTYGSAALARSIAHSSSAGSLSAGSIVGDSARTTT